jgi:hypothetical protein
MDVQRKRISVCSRCGVERRDRTRDFFGLWFVDLREGTGWCPGCAELIARQNSRQAELTCVPIPMQAIWSNRT